MFQLVPYVIMWSRTGSNPLNLHWVPNHFVPCRILSIPPHSPSQTYPAEDKQPVSVKSPIQEKSELAVQSPPPLSKNIVRHTQCETQFQSDIVKTR